MGAEPVLVPKILQGPVKRLRREGQGAIPQAPEDPAHFRAAVLPVSLRQEIFQLRIGWNDEAVLRLRLHRRNAVPRMIQIRILEPDNLAGPQQGAQADLQQQFAPAACLPEVGDQPPSLPSYFSMNEAVAKWEAMGVKVARNDEMWDPKSPASEIDAEVLDLSSSGAGINYTVFKGGNHMYTWSFAYGIRPVLDWMFAQSRDDRMAHHSMKAKDDLDSGVKACGEGNYKGALELFERADLEGNFKAARHLGIMYEQGLGVEKDPARAAALYVRAAAAGDITASFLLGDLYRRGAGVRKDLVRARALYEASAQRGDIIYAPAMVALGMLYEQGSGVRQDAAAAQVLYDKAKAAGHDVKAQLSALGK